MSRFDGPFRAHPANLGWTGSFQIRVSPPIRNSFGFLWPWGACWVIGPNTHLRGQYELNLPNNLIKMLIGNPGEPGSSICMGVPLGNKIFWISLSKSFIEREYFIKIWSVGRLKTDRLNPLVVHRGVPCWHPLPDGPPTPRLGSIPQHAPFGTSKYPCFSEWARAS